MRHPATIVLDALLVGQTVTLGKYTYRLVDEVLYVVGTRRIGDGPEEEVLLGAPHMTVSALIAEAKQLPWDDRVMIGAETVLKKMMAGERYRFLDTISNDPLAESGLR